MAPPVLPYPGTATPLPYFAATAGWGSNIYNGPGGIPQFVPQPVFNGFQGSMPSPFLGNRLPLFAQSPQGFGMPPNPYQGFSNAVFAGNMQGDPLMSLLRSFFPSRPLRDADADYCEACEARRRRRRLERIELRESRDHDDMPDSFTEARGDTLPREEHFRAYEPEPVREAPAAPAAAEDRVAAAEGEEPLEPAEPREPAPVEPPTQPVVEPAPATPPPPRREIPPKVLPALTRTVKAPRPNIPRPGVGAPEPDILAPADARRIRMRDNNERRAQTAPIWKPFMKALAQCAPGCEPAGYAAFGERPNPTCHTTGRALDVHALICGGQRYDAKDRGRFEQVVLCMRTKMKAVLYRQPGKSGTAGHYDHAHFSNGCGGGLY